MARKSILVFVLLFLLFSNLFTGIRGSGKYSGIVIFDRWDTCYISSGVYLMYITEKEKNLLRQYNGKSITIDAKEVFQPINPGDGLITKFEVIGNSEAKDNLPQINDLKLIAKPKFDSNRKVDFELEVENQGNKTIKFMLSEIAPTLFGQKVEGDFFSPSDGMSDAKITRCGFTTANGLKSEKSFTIKDREGKSIRINQKFSIYAERNLYPNSIQLLAGEKRSFNVSLEIPFGDYDFFFGYGGGGS